MAIQQTGIIHISADPLAELNAGYDPVAAADAINAPKPIACSSLTLAPGFVGPVNCDPAGGGPVYTLTTAQAQAMAAAAQAAAVASVPAVGGSCPAGTSPVSNPDGTVVCIQQQAAGSIGLGTIAAAVGVLALLIVATGGSR